MIRIFQEEECGYLIAFHHRITLVYNFYTLFIVFNIVYVFHLIYMNFDKTERMFRDETSNIAHIEAFGEPMNKTKGTRVREQQLESKRLFCLMILIFICNLFYSRLL